MKYFSLKLLEQQNNISEAECEMNNKLWAKNLAEYWSKFKSYQDRLPSRFVKEYCKHAFHDYNIESINFYSDESKRKNYCNIELKVSFDNNKFLIRYTGVTKYNINIEYINCIHENTVLYNEILPIDNTKMSHEILLVDRNIVYIEFRKIIFKRIIE